MSGCYGLQSVGLQLNGFIMQSISTIAREISHDWKNVSYAAKPYLQAMHSLDNANDSYGYDSAKAIVSYFLANASSYRGDTAKTHKSALKAIVGIK
jgi:hypothetical protein